jgi:hypothetical protein
MGGDKPVYGQFGQKGRRFKFLVYGHPIVKRRDAALFMPRTLLAPRALGVYLVYLARPVPPLASSSARLHLVPVMENASFLYI